MKLAIKYNVEPLLPVGPKSSEYKAARMAERGLRIKGTGIGQKVKGHKWERTMEARLEDRRKAMTEMPEMIRMWKQVSIVRGSLTVKSRLTIFYREVMVVAGNSGPSGKSSAYIALVCFSVVSCRSGHGTLFGVNALPPELGPLSAGVHLYESLQGFGKGVLSFFFAPIFLICTILHKLSAYNPKMPERPWERSICHCAYIARES